MAKTYAKKRGREKPTAVSERTAIYEDLSHESEDVRIKAAGRLLARLEPPAGLQNKDKDGSAAASSTTNELDYSLKRLFRGLCSNRKAARLGFSAALTEVLSQYAGERGSIALKTIIKLWLELTASSGQMDGQEARDHVLGRIFGAQALVQSGILFANPKDLVLWRQVLDELFALGTKKAWAREECGWVALASIQKLQALGRDQNWVQAILECLQRQGLLKTPEGVALWISADKLFAHLSTPSGIFDGEDPLSKRSRKQLVQILKEAVAEDATEPNPQQSQRGSWSSRPHFAWELIFAYLPEERFRDFWLEVVDGKQTFLGSHDENVTANMTLEAGLFSKASSDERKHWGFSLLSQQIASLRPDRMSDILTPNLCRCLANQVAKKDRYLHLAAMKCVKDIHARATQDAAILAPILLRLTEDDTRAVFTLGNMKKTFLDKVEALADRTTVEALTKAIGSSLNDSKPQEIESNTTRVEMIISIIRLLAYPVDSNQSLSDLRVTFTSTLDVMVRRAFFVRVSSEKDREKAKSQLWDLMMGLSVKDPLPSYYPDAIVETIHDLEKEHGDLIADDPVRKIISKAKKAVAKLKSTKKSKPPKSTKTDVSASLKPQETLRLLLCLSVIQVYSGDTEGLEALDDLLSCYKDMRSDDSSEGLSRASTAIVEIILSFTSKQSTLHRDIAQQAFSMCTGMLTADSLQSLLQVLQTKESMAGQTEMFENGDDQEDGSENEEDDGNSDSDNELDSDVEMIDAGADASGAPGSEVDVEKKQEDELEVFEAKLAEALGTRRADIDAGHGEAESSESEMDDEQMEALDAHLSEMFKQRKQAARNNGSKKEQKEAKKNIVVFKTRVLDLLKVFIEAQHHSPLALDTIPALLQLTRSSRGKQLTEKAAALIREYSKLVKLGTGPGRRAGAQSNGKQSYDSEDIASGSSSGSGSGSSDSNESDSNDDAPVAASAAATTAEPGTVKIMKRRSKQLLGEVHERIAVQVGGSNLFQKACSQASILLVKVYLTHSGGDIAHPLALYARSEATWTTSPPHACGLRAVMFRDWLDWRETNRAKLV